jgi:hypothetical protein
MVWRTRKAIQSSGMNISIAFGLPRIQHSGLRRIYGTVSKVCNRYRIHGVVALRLLGFCTTLCHFCGHGVGLHNFAHAGEAIDAVWHN